MIEIRIKAYRVSELLPETSRSVLVWRSGAAFGFLKGHWEISKCRLTKSGPRWECDELGPIPLPMSMCRQVTHWAELPRDAFCGGWTPTKPLPEAPVPPASRPIIAQPTPDSRPMGPPNDIKGPAVMPINPPPLMPTPKSPCGRFTEKEMELLLDLGFEFVDFTQIGDAHSYYVLTGYSRPAHDSESLPSAEWR